MENRSKQIWVFFGCRADEENQGHMDKINFDLELLQNR